MPLLGLSMALQCTSIFTGTSEDDAPRNRRPPASRTTTNSTTRWGILVVVGLLLSSVVHPFSNPILHHTRQPQSSVATLIASTLHRQQQQQQRLQQHQQQRQHQRQHQQHASSPTRRSATVDFSHLESIDVSSGSDSDLWQSGLSGQPYISSMIWKTNSEWKDFVVELLQDDPDADPLWDQIRMEATASLGPEPEAGPLVYQSILSQPSLVEAIVTVIAHELATELVSAIELRNLFLQLLTDADHAAIATDVVAAATRSPSIGTAMTALLFQTGLHALVCYRVGHRLWLADRHGLAYYLQSAVSRRYSADIHPACQMGTGIYLSTTAGVVIGETAAIGNDVSILQGVTLGGSGKERGDRHPKVGNGVILMDGATVLGNIPVGDGALITAKSIVTKPVPPLAIMAGVPAKIRDFRTLQEGSFTDDLSRHLASKYLDKWKHLGPTSEDSPLNI